MDLFILKANNEEITSTEIIIEEVRKQPNKVNVDHSILDDIEKTMIIRLDNYKTYKVSPVKPKKTEYIKDITQVFDAINYQNAEIKEDVFIELEPKKKKKKAEPNINLTEVESKIDEFVELSNTKVLEMIKSEPVNSESIKKVKEQKEQEKTTKTKPKRRSRKSSTKKAQKQTTSEK